MLKESGLSCQESQLTVQPNGKLLIPLQNYREQISLDQRLEPGKIECFGNTVKPEPEPEPVNDPTLTRCNATGETSCAYVTTDASFKRTAQYARRWHVN